MNPKPAKTSKVNQYCFCKLYQREIVIFENELICIHFFELPITYSFSVFNTARSVANSSVAYCLSTTFCLLSVFSPLQVDSSGSAFCNFPFCGRCLDRVFCSGEFVNCSLTFFALSVLVCIIYNIRCANFKQEGSPRATNQFSGSISWLCHCTARILEFLAAPKVVHQSREEVLSPRHMFSPQLVRCPVRATISGSSSHERLSLKIENWSQFY